MKTIKKSVQINASKEKVWEVLLQDKYTKVWYSEFKEGSHAITDWKEGGKALFLDNEGYGMISKIVSNKPYELISMVYEGVVINGKEDYTGEIALQYKGGKEIYKLLGENGVITLEVETDMPEDHIESMEVAWENALKKLKELSEKNLS